MENNFEDDSELINDLLSRKRQAVTIEEAPSDQKTDIKDETGGGAPKVEKNKTEESAEIEEEQPREHKEPEGGDLDGAKFALSIIDQTRAFFFSWYAYGEIEPEFWKKFEIYENIYTEEGEEEHAQILRPLSRVVAKWVVVQNPLTQVLILLMVGTAAIFPAAHQVRKKRLKEKQPQQPKDAKIREISLSTSPTSPEKGEKQSDNTRKTKF